MALTLRTVSNSGAALYYPDGNPIVGAEVRFQLVDQYGTQTDTFDATTGERITGFFFTATDANGVFTANVWPNDRGIASTQYRCTISTPLGTNDILAAVPTGAGTYTWLQFVTAGTIPAPTPIPTVEYTSHKDAANGYVGLTGFDIDFYNAAGTFKSLLHNTNAAARTYTFQDRTGTIADLGANVFTAAQTAPQFISNVAIGTPPLVVTSTTPVTNLSIGGNANTATNLAGGVTGSLPYQSGVSTTAYLGIGTIGYVLTQGATAPQWSRPGTYGTLGQPALVVTVGATNCNYTTIQAALNANVTANLMVLVYPGTYTNDTVNFTANNQCVIGLGAGEQQVITAASATLCSAGAFTSCVLRNVTLSITAATTAVSCVTVSTGKIDMDDVYLACTNSTVTAATQPSVASISGSGTIELSHVDATYTNNVSDGTGTTAIKAAFLPGNGIILAEFVTLISAGSGQSLGHTSSFTVGTGYTNFIRSNATITDTGTTVVAGYYANGASVLADLELAKFVLTGGAAASVIGVYLLGTTTLDSEYCSFTCTGGLTNYSGNVGAGCVWNTTFDTMTAASETTGAGTINYASSPAAGQFKAGTITATTTMVTPTATLSTTIADNTATTQGANTVWVKSQIANDKNSAAMSQGVNLTAGSGGGVTGIQVANNTQIQFGLGSYSMFFDGALANWNTGSIQFLMYKYQDNNNYYALYIDATGKLVATQTQTGQTTLIGTSTVATGFVAGTRHKLLAIVVPPTAVVAGSITFYVDGVQLGNQIVLATTATPASSTNTGILYILGSPNVRHAGAVFAYALFNRALSAADVLDLFRNGVNFADKGASQAELVTNGTFTGSAAGWTLQAGWAYGTNNLVATAAASSSQAYQTIVPSSGSTYGMSKKFRVSFTISGYSSGSIYANLGGTITTTRNANGTYVEEVTIVNATNTIFSITTVGASTSLTIDDVSCVQIGATAQYEPEYITSAAWYDSSGNGNTATYPATGSSLVREEMVNADTVQAITGVKTMTNMTSAAGTTTVPSRTMLAGTLMTTPTAGVEEFDAVSFYNTIDTSSGRGQLPVRQYFHLTAAGGAITTIANFFGATSNISLVASAYYEIEIVCFFLKTTADTVVWTLTNSAAPTGQNIRYEMSPITGIVAPPGTATLLSGQVYNDATAAYTFTTGTLTTGANHYAKFKISLKNGAGTNLKIQATATTGSLTPGIGSYWTCTRIPAGNTGTFAA